MEGDDIIFKVCLETSVPSRSKSKVNSSGRPKKSFNESSYKSKRRRIDDLIQTRSTNELAVAAEVSTRLAGNRNAARIIRNAHKDQERSLGANDTMCVSSRCLTSDEGLAYYVDRYFLHFTALEKLRLHVILLRITFLLTRLVQKLNFRQF